MIDIQNLEVHNEGGRLLSSASFRLKKGVFLSIFGPSSSGKTLLLNFIADQQNDGLKYSSESHWTRTDPIYFLKQGETPQNQFLKHPNFYQSLVLVDEPENNFTIEEFSLLAKKMKEHDGTLVFSTHHLDFLESFADEILVLRYGEFKGVYSKESFFNNDDPYIDYLSRMGC